MTDPSDLIERVRKAEGPTDPTLRYIDCHLWVLGQGGDARMCVCDSSAKDFVWERGIGGFWVRDVVKFRDVPKYTASIDAITVLIEKKLPGQWPTILERAIEFVWAENAPQMPVGRLLVALCLALLLSLQESSK